MNAFLEKEYAIRDNTYRALFHFLNLGFLLMSSIQLAFKKFLYVLSAKRVDSFYFFTNFSGFQILFSDSNTWWPSSSMYLGHCRELYT